MPSVLMLCKKNIPDSVDEVVEHFSWKSLIVQEKSAQERNVEIIGLIYIFRCPSRFPSFYRLLQEGYISYFYK